jgi:ParB family chromosome partitioning protein
LGRGLSTLLGDSGIAATAGQSQSLNSPEYQKIPIEWINVGPWQPRRQFKVDHLNELAVSIQQKGVVQPILLRQTPDKTNRFQLVAGERRWRAAQIAQLHEIPAVVRQLSDTECHEIALIENIQREDLTVIEEALGYSRLLEINDYTQDQLSKIIGKSRSHIANLLRLLTLSEPVQTLLRNGDLTMGQARPLVGHPQAEGLAKTIIAKKLSARQAERLAKSGAYDGPSSNSITKQSEKSADIRAIEQRAALQLGLVISIDWNEQSEKGHVQIKCQSIEQLNALINKLGIAG